jgi:hypothetical protein
MKTSILPAVSLALACAVPHLHAGEIRYPSGAVLRHDFGTKLITGSMYRLRVEGSRLSTRRAGEINLTQLSASSVNVLTFRKGLEGQSLKTSKFQTAVGGWMVLVGPGTFSASNCSGAGGIYAAAADAADLVVNVTDGNLAYLNVAAGQVNANNVRLSEFIVGGNGRSSKVTATLAHVSTNGLLATTGSKFSTCRVQSGGFLEIAPAEPAKTSIDDLTVTGTLTINPEINRESATVDKTNLANTLTVGKLTSFSGRLRVRLSGPPLAVGDTFTLIRNTGATASPAFTNVAEGKDINTEGSNPTVLTISYTGGPATSATDAAGNDVVATVKSLPTPAAAAEN